MGQTDAQAPDFCEEVQVSIIVPVLDEEENVGLLCQRIREALRPTGRPYELIIVDDGSTDDTVGALLRAQQHDAAIRVIQLRKNFGQTPALRCGIEHARGSWIVTMDGDLQNDPSDISALLEKIEQGFDLVCGWRLDRKDALISRKVPSRIANRLIARLTGIAIHDTGCSLKAYRAAMIRQIPLYAELHRFIPAMSSLAGARIAEVIVRHHPRIAGESKYGLSRIGRVLLDVLTVRMLTGYWRRPLHYFGLLSIASIAVAMLPVSAMAPSASEGVHIGTMVCPIVAFLFAQLAIHFLMMGLLGELIIRKARAPCISPVICHRAN